MKKRELNNSEMEFNYFLADFEISCSVKNIETQVEVYADGIYKRIVDFVITLNNGYKIYIETDGDVHLQDEIKRKDLWKDYYAERHGIPTIIIKFNDWKNNKQKVANEIEAMIDLLNGA